MRLPLGDKNTLIGKATRALGWSFASTAGGRLATLGIGVVLARLLGPHAFGTFAVALVATLAVGSFNELGVSLAIVRWQGDPAEIVPTVMTLSLISSFILYVGCFFGAPAFASAMGAPAATGVIRVLTLNVLVDGIVGTPAAVLQRNFRQDQKLIVDQVNNWLGAAVSIGLAVSGFGAMSLAIGRMAGAVAAGILFFVFCPVPVRPGFDPVKARALLHFGLPLAGASLLVFGVANVDQLVVGHVLGATMLGFYVLAFNMSSWPVSVFSLPVRNVAPAVFSRLQHDKAAMRTGFLSGIGVLGSVTLPACLLICGASVPLIGFLYGPRWMPAAQALMWLALLGALRILFEFVYDFFVVLARSRVVFTVQLVWLAALTPAVIVGAHARGISGVGMAQVAVTGCVVLPWYLSELSKVGIKRRALGAKLWLPLLASAGVALFAVGLGGLVTRNVIVLVASGIISLGTISLLLYHMKPELVMLKSVLRDPSESRSATADVDQFVGEHALQHTAEGTVYIPADAGNTSKYVTEPGAVPVASAQAPWPDMTMPIPVIEERSGRALMLGQAFYTSDSTMPLPVLADIGGPLPLYRDTIGLLPRRHDTTDHSQHDPYDGRQRAESRQDQTDPAVSIPRKHVPWHHPDDSDDTQVLTFRKLRPTDDD
jgi:O-antigen/teichoic acid export membrane protein